MSSSFVLVQQPSESIFFLKLNFWYGAFVVLGVGTALQALMSKRFKLWWQKRKNFSLFILGRPEAPGLPGSGIPPASERLGNVESDLKEQHKDIKVQGADIKSQGADIQEIKSLLKNVNESLSMALDLAVNTNLKVTNNGGETDSLPDAMQRVARKMGVWDHEGKPPISVANLIEAHDLLPFANSEKRGREDATAPESES